MKINNELIRKLKPCQNRMDNFEKEYPNYNENLSDFLQLDKITFADKIWVSTRVMTKTQMVKFMMLCAESTLYIFEDKHPEDKRPKECLEYLKTFESFENLTKDEKEELIKHHKFASAAYDAVVYNSVASAAFAYISVAHAAYYAVHDVAFVNYFFVSPTCDVSVTREDILARKIQEEKCLKFILDVLAQKEKEKDIEMNDVIKPRRIVTSGLNLGENCPICKSKSSLIPHVPNIVDIYSATCSNPRCQAQLCDIGIVSGLWSKIYCPEVILKKIIIPLGIPPEATGLSITPKGSDNYRTAITLMLINEQEETVKRVLAEMAAAKVNVNVVDAVANAAKNGHLEFVKYLVENGAKIGDHAVGYASLYGHLDVVKYLIEKGATIGDSAVFNAAENGHLDVVKYLVDKLEIVKDILKKAIKEAEHAE